MARRPEPENWQRWPPHQAWPALPPAFVMEQSYTITPLITMPAPQYPIHHGFVYDAYSAPEATNSIVSSTKQYLAERALLDMTPVPGHNLVEPLQETNHLPAKQSSLSPIIKSESQPPESLKNPRAITANTADGQASNVVFATGIDRLMKIIQLKNDGSEGDAPVTQPKPKARANNSSADGPTSRKRSKVDNHTSSVELNDKPHACHRKKCHKRFSQITHLHIHDRAHTGERPHKCTFAGCDKRFTQKGNLRTHQNNYHKEELRELELKFANMRSVTEMTEADRELWDYFLTVHKNSNKGIKGRGKECRVELLPHSGSLPNQYPLQSPVELQHTPFPMSHSLANSMNFGHFGMQRANLGQDFLVARGGHGYDVYEIDQASISSGTITPASSPGGMYDDHHRGLPFHDRMY
ncbi:hypothetical protein E0Z10_g6506 [Xylaria hypoxylon]|uniref:C2H2-type domain-containing protein n=1 Tax=Xylaria hypoxylon TaxID=37992 RepID=A0A4Z0YDG0_9PEZI|nr:hypothetical protein E0Z10_g6506 [Xylaria hypoxylon]